MGQHSAGQRAPVPAPPSTSSSRTQPSGNFRRLIRYLGWRAAAIPALSVVTVGAVAHIATSAPTAADAAAPHHPAGHARESLVAQTHQQPAAPAATLAAPGATVVRTITDADACADNHHARLALVSLHEQHAWMCRGHRQVYSAPVTTGAHFDDRRTPTGTWTVQGRERDRYLNGVGYSSFVHYWVPFNGDYGFHDAPWQKTGYGSPTFFVKHGSHGCVHFPRQAMKWVYDWSKVGKTTVTVEA